MLFESKLFADCLALKRDLGRRFFKFFNSIGARHRGGFAEVLAALTWSEPVEGFCDGRKELTMKP
jgi:hypothetical protein